MPMNVDTIYRMFAPYFNQSTQVSTTSIDKAFGGRYSLALADGTDDINDTSEITNILAKVYCETVNTRSDLYDLVDSIKDTDASQYILESIADDAFNSVDTNEPFTITYLGNKYDAEDVQEEIDSFVKKFDLYQLFMDIIDDFLIYGEYYLQTEVKQGKGIVAINDTVNSKNVFSIYRNYKLLEHIGFNNETEFSGTAYSSATSQIVRIHKDLLTHFVLDARKVRIRVTKESSIIALPDVIRVGRSILYPAIKLLKRSNILDTAILAKDLRSALLPLILSIAMPNVSDPIQAIEAAKKYEKYFSDNAGLSQLAMDGELTVSSIFSNTGKIKIAPTFQGGKAELAKMDLDGDTSSIQASKDKTDERINAIVGLPDASENKTRFEILKTQSRYSKKLIDLQRCSANGLRDLVYKHLKYKGIYIDEHNIVVKFKSILNADIFEEAEGIVSLMSVMNDLNSFIQSIADNENLGIGVHPEALIDTFKQFLGSRYITLEKLLYKKKVNNAQQPTVRNL